VIGMHGFFVQARPAFFFTTQSTPSGISSWSRFPCMHIIVTWRGRYSEQ
jgi:hypothetical protein